MNTKNDSTPLLLNALQMASFANEGVLLCADMVPQELNRAVHEDEKNLARRGYEFWDESTVLREVFNLPQVQGAIQSFVGANPIYDHSFLHFVAPGNLKRQNWHVDSGTFNTNPFHFDIQAFYFAHDTPIEMGPTLVLPGSHLRRATYWNIGRYKNIAGQRPMVAKAGSIAFMHQDIWHCAQANQTEKTRYVFKVRYKPAAEQQKCFNLEGVDSPEVKDMIGKQQPWYGSDFQKDWLQKLEFWRHLSGDDHLHFS